MELTIEQQIFDTLGKAKKVLIALPEALNADSVASGLALLKFLKKLDKDAEVVSSGHVPENLKFLPGSGDIKSDVVSSKSLVVVVDTSQKKLDEISYQTTDNEVQIFLKAKQGQLSSEDVSFASEKFPVDAIVILESKSLETLGSLFEKNADMFFETPKINIDTHADNEYFGAVNLVDITASSVAEILSSLFEKYEKQLMDEDIATCLLTGIVTKTNSFQHVRTTPRAFVKASELIAQGGRQQEVVKHVYKTKSLSFLRVWGRALARLKLPDSLPVVYSMLNAADFAKAEADPSETEAVLKELCSNISSYKVLAVISEVTEKAVKYSVAVHTQVDAGLLAALLGGQQGKLADINGGLFKMFEATLSGLTLAEAEQKFLDAINSMENLAASR